MWFTDREREKDREERKKCTGIISAMNRERERYRERRGERNIER